MIFSKDAPISEQLGADRWARWEMKEKERIYKQMLHDHCVTDGQTSDTCEACIHREKLYDNH